MAASGNDILKSAIESFQTGRLDDAERLFKSLLAQQPNHVAALNILGVLLASRHKYTEAEPYLRSALKFTANSDATLYNYGIVLKGLGRSAEALEYFSKALAINPAVPDTWNNRGTVHNDLKHYEQAVQDFDRAIALQPNHPDACHNKGNSLQQLKRYDDACDAYDRALALKPDRVEGWMGRGNALNGLKRYGDALAAYDRALALKADLLDVSLGRGHAMLGLGRFDEAAVAYGTALTMAPDPVTAWLRYGGSLSEFRRYDEALAAFDKALALKPDLADAWLGRGNVSFLLKRHEDALAAYDKALVHNPGLAEAWLGRGNVLTELRGYDGALAAYGRALELAPDLVAAGLGRGHVFFREQRYEDALSAYDKLTTTKPDFAEAWLGRGTVFARLNRLQEAFTAFDRAFTLKSDLNFVEGQRLYSKQFICDWRNLEAEWDHLRAAVRSGFPASDPFTILVGPSSAAEQLKCAQTYTADVCPTDVEPLWRGERYSHDRIRLAYLSADFRDHALPHLLARMFELHDHERFETIAIALGPDDQSEMRARLKRAFERFIDVNDYSDKDIARLIRDLEVDIVVDLTGFTSASRSELLAFRPAPVQVNYLYPGMTSHVDYVFGDRFVIPEEHLPLFSQPVVYLPHSCFAYDSAQPISDRVPSRAENGLPEAGFVFCAFNNTYKLGPQFFDIWMRLLKNTPQSVLWLSPANAAAVNNLRQEAQARGVEPSRLCFAPFVKDMADHLARYRLADLFLDALPFNAHTTALDALWAGLPVLTSVGSTFVGRVAAGLLSAMQLPELITHSSTEYEALALKLATDAPLLAGIRGKLADNRLTTPLFDAGLFTRHVETAYEAMLERHRRGLASEHLVIPH